MEKFVIIYENISCKLNDAGSEVGEIGIFGINRTRPFMDYESAKQEAIKMAKAYKGMKYQVFQLMGTAEQPKESRIWIDCI